MSSERVRFHLDEHIASAIAIALRQRGIEVTTSAEANLLGATDEEQLEFARQAQRVMVTHDDDYLSLHALGVPHAGIAYCRQGTRTIGEMLQTLTLIYELISSDEMLGKVVYL
jgi:predicted nuclease of predicted toxin-antitoxin system